ncbi:MAG: hypothetical protein EPN97_05675 [Alphaproteobacteria bacterium]|nr:MAG: hypothetical protein EPN97_05675 [Alphaproteobacteria bacterium]
MLTPEQQKLNEKAKAELREDMKKLGRAFRAVAHVAAVCAVVYGGAGFALHTAWKGVTFTRTYEGRAEHTFKDGSHRRVDGRGFSFTNPFAIADTTKWELQSQTAYFNSARKEPDRFHAEVSFSFVGPHELSTYGRISDSAREAGDRTLKEIFQKNGWTSYAAVDPAMQPQNARALCDALSTAIIASLDPKTAEGAKVTECGIKVTVPFKGYTAKI